MKVIHMESGLGNQMLDYVEYLAIKKANPQDDIYIETIIYDIPEASKVIAQWNGYELERIFGIKIPNVKALFSNAQWQDIIDEVKDSKFWENGWDFPEPICNALNKYLPKPLINICKTLDRKKYITRREILLTRFYRTWLGFKLRSVGKKIRWKKYVAIYKHPEKLFYEDSRDLYCGFTMLFQYRGNRIETLDKEIRQAFVFPQLTNSKDIEICKEIHNSNAIAIHIRRGDQENSTSKYFTGGYYKKAVKYMKKHVENPVFFLFSDPGSSEWVRKNLRLIGLKHDDDYYFIDWHIGNDNYIDMQLMSECQHAIISVSTFSWFGAYLISNTNKIVISPEVEINTSHHI